MKVLEARRSTSGRAPSCGRKARWLIGGMLVAVGLAVPASSASAASMYVYDFAMNTATVTTYGGDWSISGAFGAGAFYRWVDSPPSTSRISSNVCSNYDLYQAADYGVGDVAYRNIGEWSTNSCLRLRGRSTGSAFYDHDGNLNH